LGKFETIINDSQCTEQYGTLTSNNEADNTQVCDKIPYVTKI